MRSFLDIVGNLDFERLVIEDTALNGVDARIKLFTSVSLIFAVCSMVHPQIPFLIFFISTLVSFVIGIPPNTMLKRLISPLMIAFVVFIIVLFTYGGQVGSNFFGLPIYKEGFDFGLLIFSRIVASISILNIFTAITPISEILSAMRWFRVPAVFVDLFGMMIRYVSLLSKEGVRMYKAQKSRFAFSDELSYKRKIQNLGMLAGSLFLRAYSRGEKVYLTMLSRGYNIDSNLVGKTRRLTVKEITSAFSILSLAILLVIIDHFPEVI